MDNILVVKQNLKTLEFSEHLVIKHKQTFQLANELTQQRFFIFQTILYAHAFFLIEQTLGYCYSKCVKSSGLLFNNWM